MELSIKLVQRNPMEGNGTNISKHGFDMTITTSRLIYTQVGGSCYWYQTYHEIQHTVCMLKALPNY